MHKKGSWLLMALAVLNVSSLALAAKQTTADGRVAHSRRAPVVLHRAVPPYKGVHVYQPNGQR